MGTARATGRRRGRPLDPLERAQVARRVSEGGRAEDIATSFGCSAFTVYRIRDEAQVRRRRVSHSQLRLSFCEREQISRGLADGESARAIARQLERAPSTISREIIRAGGPRRYRALTAERHA